MKFLGRARNVCIEGMRLRFLNRYIFFKLFSLRFVLVIAE
jgi:hypothetical protein